MREVDTIKSCQDKMRRHLEQVVVLNLFLNFAHTFAVVVVVDVVVFTPNIFSTMPSLFLMIPLQQLLLLLMVVLLMCLLL